MDTDALKWNQKHKENPLTSTPLELLQKYIALANKGRALDIACGMGRNSLFMRDNGFCVDSVDISNFALEHLKSKENINPICADLDVFKITPCSYDLICNSYFLERRLFPFMVKGLKKDGILIFETFVKSAVKEYNAFAQDSTHLLRKNELLRAFFDLEILFYEEVLIERIKDSSLAFVARLVAKA